MHKVTSDKSIKERSGKLYDAHTTTLAQQATPATSKSGHGLNSGLCSSTIILPSSPTELKKELMLILASLQAGNNFTDMKNKAASIIDQLRKKKKIGVSKERELLLYLVA